LSVEPLSTSNTVEVSRVRHRLAIGVQWIDALTQAEVASGWVSDLEAVGTRPWSQRWDLHPRGRHALRWAGRIASLLARGDADNTAAPPPFPDMDATNFVLRAYGLAGAGLAAYSTDDDPRRFVPRRLSLTPVQSGGRPSLGTGNVRTALVWPGATYPLPSNASAVRGRVQRGASLATAKPAAWARIVVTAPEADPPVFADEEQVGWGHGDDRGEFLVALGPDAVPGGAALPATIPLNVWAFLPAADTFDPDDPLASVPLEFAGTDTTSAVLDGREPPAAYVSQAPVAVTLTPGRVLTMNEADLLFS
jgi:hypothetical protein